MASYGNQPQSRQSSGPHLETTRLRFQTILFATDFSPTADLASETAMAFAQWFGGSVVSVYALPPILYSGEGPMDPSILETNKESARFRMNKLGLEMKKRSIQHEEIVSTEPPVTAIEKAAATHRADLIIVGSHGAHGLEKLLLGSVAEAVLRRSHLPVMVVGPNCKPPGSSPFKSILLATDLEAGSLRSAQYAASLAEETGARLTLLHVASDKSEVSESAREAVQERLKHLLPADAELWCRPAVRVEVGTASPQIVNAAMAEEADLIVVATREAGLFSNHAPWSTISKIIQSATCPVLAVPAHSK